MGLLNRKYGIWDSLTEQWLIAEFANGSAMWAPADGIDWDNDGPMVFDRRKDARAHIMTTFTERDMLSVERVA